MECKVKVLLLSDPPPPPKPKTKVPATIVYKGELQPLLHIAYVSINYLLLQIAFPDISIDGTKNIFY